ncbi:MAG: hypothetical protein GXX79_08835 [Actinomycetales bacterium]|nr:hypothetical protein [Actinomycetales bacterium]
MTAFSRPQLHRGRPRTVRTGPVAVGVLAALLSTLLVGPGTARAATRYGNDVSWPQCPVADGGFDLPMPRDTAEFAVVGLTFGLPFTENPCLASQVAWMRERALPTHGYTMAAFPTAEQLTTYGDDGPWSTATRAGRLANVGYAEGTFALASLASVGFEPPMVWVDVEPRSRQPWPTGTATRQAENRYVVTGLVRALADAGVAYGFYSYANGWTEITGGWRLPGIPVWATAGRRGKDAAAAMCAGPSFSGGPVQLAQWYDDVRDDDLTCPAYVHAPPVPWPPSDQGDLTGDWASDVVARGTSTGVLYIRPGTGRGTIGPRIQQPGSTWSAMNLIDTPGDLSGDGIPDVMTREGSTGYLWLYRRTAAQGWAARIRIGTGWGVMSRILGPGDLTGDGRPDVLGVQKSTGYLWLYPGTGSTTSPFSSRRKVGTGWGAMNLVVGPGDLTGDGRPDLLARQASTGRLWLYPGNGSGGWGTRVSIGTGWGVMDRLVGPGDFSGDNVPDLLARQKGRDYLWLYQGKAGGGFAPRVRVSASWQAYDLMA